MEKLTLEQKAKRYEYLENVFLEYLDSVIEDTHCDEQYDLEKTPVVELVNKEMDALDDVLPRDLLFLFDKICDENFFTYKSIGKTIDKATAKRYNNFEKLIGERK